MNIYYFWWCQTHQQCASHELSVKVLSHEVTCHHDMSLQQNHIQQWDLTLQHVAVTSYRSRLCRREGPWSVYLRSYRSNMSHGHVTRGDQMCVQHFVTTTWICMNSSWFEFIWQVPASNCIKTYMSHEVICHGDVSWRQVALCDRTFSVRVVNWPIQGTTDLLLDHLPPSRVVILHLTQIEYIGHDAPWLQRWHIFSASFATITKPVQYDRALPFCL